MGEGIIAFIIWAVVGLLFIGIAISAFSSDEPVGFWSNAEMFEVTDVKKYNYAVGKLWVAFSVIFVLLGLPLLSKEHEIYALFSAGGVMLEIIGIMIVYTQVIEKKYKKLDK